MKKKFSLLIMLLFLLLCFTACNNKNKGDLGDSSTEESSVIESETTEESSVIESETTEESSVIESETTEESSVTESETTEESTVIGSETTDVSDGARELTTAEKTAFSQALAGDYSNVTILDYVFETIHYVADGLVQVTGFDENDQEIDYYYLRENDGYGEIYGCDYFEENNYVWDALYEGEYAYFTFVFNFSLVDVNDVLYSDAVDGFIIDCSDLAVEDFLYYFYDEELSFSYIYFHIGDNGLFDLIGEENDEYGLEYCELFDFGSTSVSEPDSGSNETTVSISNFKAMANGESATVCGKVVAVSERGYVICDVTDALYVYSYKSSDSAIYQVGDCVSVTGERAYYNGDEMIPSSSELLPNEEFDDPEVKAMNASDMDAYITGSAYANQYIQIIGTLSTSGNFYNVKVDGATAVLSISFPTASDKEVLADYIGQEVIVTGWSVGISQPKYLNMILSSITFASGDHVAPVISAPVSVNATLGDDYGSIIINAISATDDVDGEITITKDMLTIPLVEGIGDYNVTIKVSDIAGNEATKVIVLIVNVQPGAPIIEVENTVFQYNKVSEVPDLKTLFTVTDEKDGNIIVCDEMLNVSNDDLTNFVNSVTLTVTDSDSITSVKTIKVVILANGIVDTKETIKKLEPNDMPSVGEAKALVIPIAIGDNPATEAMKNNIEKAFFGSDSDTGWESLASYYYKSSYGKLNITGTVTDWYKAKNTQSYYANYSDEDNYFYGSTILLNEALEYFDDTYDYSEFDANSDGYIDAVYLIYNVAIGGNGSSAEEEFYWAYTYWDWYCDDRDYANSTKGYAHCFASYYFIEEELYYSDNQPAINAETYIHETGHLLGLDDYYDYDSQYNSGGYNGCDMMDYNIGDHCPYSKTVLGWIDPVVISESGVYTLPSFTETGTYFLITANGTFSSIFSEYYTIDFYTFAGLNEREMPTFFNTNDNYAGVRVSLVCSQLVYDDYYYTKYNNSDPTNKLVKMLEADYNGVKFDCDTLDQSGYFPGASLSDFYRVSDVFGGSNYAKFKTNSGYTVPFTMTVLSIDNNAATIEIVFK